MEGKSNGHGLQSLCISVWCLCTFDPVIYLNPGNGGGRAQNTAPALCGTELNMCHCFLQALANFCAGREERELKQMAQVSLSLSPISFLNE